MAIWYKDLWFTDRVDIYRISKMEDSDLSMLGWKPVKKDVPCRRYTKNSQGLQVTNSAGQTIESGKLMVEKDVDIIPGDQLILHSDGNDHMFYAGTVNNYYIPFHGKYPPLDHKEVELTTDPKRATV